MALDPLLEPFELGNVTLRNRVVSTSHEPAFTEDGMPKDRYRRYQVEKARGGVGLTMIGGSAIVGRDSPPAFGNLEMYRDEIVPWLRTLSDDVHENGAALTIQLTHLGRRTSNYLGDWLPVLSASRVREPQHRAFPKEAESWDVDRVVSQYAEAAERAMAGGMDGIELEHYGHFIDSFVSPWLNQRGDDYNGTLLDRLDVGLRVVKAVRAAVGDDAPIGVRMSLDEDLPHGLHPGEAIDALKHYADAGISFVSVIHGTIGSDKTLSEAIPGMGTPSAPYLDLCAAVKREVAMPVMHAARIADVPTARYAVREQLVDLVGMTRAQIADPYLVNKIAAGDEDRIRPCVGASYCLDAIYDSGSTKCIHNPAVGREASLPHEIEDTAEHPLSVLIVGAGPAGLEAARVCAARGHTVTVHEANESYGGQVAIAARSERRRELRGIIDWRYDEAIRLGADFVFNQLTESGDVEDISPEVVVVATGGVPDTDIVEPGGELVNDTWDVMTGSLTTGEALVYDDAGGYPALDAVEYLASHDAKVHYVTPERTIGTEVGSMNSPAYLEVIDRYGVAVTLAKQLRSVRRASATSLTAELFSEYGGTTTTVETGTVVIDHGTVPNDDLYHDLKDKSSNGGEVDYDALLSGGPQALTRNPDGRFQLFRIGDAVASRNIHAAILDALRLAITI
ncbi:FAD-dependent oxidoreductase [Arthrobacter castelli]|uniref:oxidoreductase n=1 Tax=Arthrobacter castelli TaxID=271431 RepID=UPI000417CFD0|nr:FAD-dependent oxidoreductase [Arthrobacter castelli]